jgi:hypothetical protein
MFRGEYKALISDVDGTLTKVIPDALPSENVTNCIKKAVNQGLIFSLATGRPYSLVKNIVDHLGIIGPSIVDNGAVIIDSNNGSVLWEALLPNDRANTILKLSRSYPLVLTSTDTAILQNPKVIPAYSKVRKVSIHNITFDKAKKLIEEVTNELKDVTTIQASSYEGIHLTDVYFSASNATKQHAVVELLKILGITREEAIGVGDGYNDFSLLMACGFKIAMENAVDELKNIADFIAPSVDDDGIVDILEKYILL